jgi:hypothetical protein
MKWRTSTLVGAMLPALVLVCGCASMQATEWKGHKIDDVVKEFGPPTQTVPAADGETMYLWAFEHSFSQASPNQTTTWCFLVNQEGTVVSWHRDDGAMY